MIELDERTETEYILDMAKEGKFRQEMINSLEVAAAVFSNREYYFRDKEKQYSSSTA